MGGAWIAAPVSPRAPSPPPPVLSQDIPGAAAGDGSDESTGEMDDDAEGIGGAATPALAGVGKADVTS